MYDIEILSKRRVNGCFIAFRGNVAINVEVLSFDITYSLNQLPTATVTIPLGIEALSNRLSTGYNLLGSILYRVPAILFYSVTNQDKHLLTKNISTGTYVLFAGYATAVYAGVEFGRQVLTIKLTHWLSDLDHTSTLSALSHPDNPKDTLFNPALAPMVLGSGPVFSLSALSQTVTNIYAAFDDFWGNAIVPFINFLMSVDRINVDVFMGAGNDSIVGNARRAFNSYLNSILRLNIGTLGLNAPYIIDMMLNSLFGVFDQQGTDDQSVNIQEQSFLDSLAQTTLWKKLRDLAIRYLFMIIPYPLHYQVVPFTPALYDVYNPYIHSTSIAATEILKMDVESKPPIIPLRALGIYTEVHTHLGSSLNNASQYLDPFIGGWYISVNHPGEGMVEIVRPPEYLSMPYEPSIYARDSMGLSLPRLCSSKNPFDRIQGHYAQQSLLANNRASVLDRYAQFIYVMRQSADKIISVTCPFRGDIAPGSSISIMPNNSAFLPDNLTNSILYGLVVEVNYSQSIQQVPKTKFTVAFIRTAAEVNSTDFSLYAHPLYDPYWKGGIHIPSA